MTLSGIESGSETAEAVELGPPDPPRDPLRRPISEDLKRTLLQTAGIETHDLPITRMRSYGAMNAVYALGSRLVLRIPLDTPRALDNLQREPAGVRVACSAQVRTPRLVAFDGGTSAPVPFAIYERWPGGLMGLEAPASRDELAALGADLGRLHAHSGASTGEVRLPTLDRYPNIVESGALGELEAMGLLGSMAVDWAAETVEALAPVVESRGFQPVLLHGDVRPLNVLVAGGQYVGLLDWGRCALGDPALDFRNLPLRDIPIVLEGYSTVGSSAASDVGFCVAIVWEQLGRAFADLRDAKAPHHADWAVPPASRLVELLATFWRSPVAGPFGKRSGLTFLPDK